MRRLYASIRLGRPLFLGGGVALHMLGVAAALFDGASLNLKALVWGQIAITAIQWMTHYSNDYFDLEADRANLNPARWSGGSRILPEGALSPWVAIAAAAVLACLGILAAFILAFVLRTGPLTLPLLLLALLLAWFYSAPPLRLHSTGWGETVTVLLVPVLTPLTGFYLQRGRLEPLPLVAVIPLACLQLAMLLAIEIPDMDGDRTVGKRTLVVRLGPERASRLYILLLATAYASLPLLVLLGLPLLAALAVGLMSPLAAWQVWRIRRGDPLNPAHRDRFSFFSIGLLAATAFVEAIAFVLLLGL